MTIPIIKNQLHESEARWFAIYTGFRREKKVVERLEKKGIQTYLPLKHVTRRYTRKVKHLSIPLINCYVFVHITKDQYVPILQDPDVNRFVKIAKRLIAIPEHEIQLMQRVVGEKEGVEAIDMDSWRQGDTVEVIGGELTGLKGKLVNTAGKDHLLIELQHIGVGLQMEVDRKLLRRVRRATEV